MRKCGSPTSRRTSRPVERNPAFARTLTEERSPMRRSGDRNVWLGNGRWLRAMSGALPGDGGDASSGAWTARWTLPWSLSIPGRSRMPSLPRMVRTSGMTLANSSASSQRWEPAAAPPCGSRSALGQVSDPYPWARPRSRDWHGGHRGTLPGPLQVDRLAVSENMDAGARRETSDSVGECHGRPIDQIGALWKADGPPGSAVHRNSVDWVRAADRLSRLLGIEMARPEGRPPSCDWHESEVDVCHFVEPQVRTRVPRIPAPVVSLDQIAERGSAMRASRVSPTIMVGCEDVYP